MHEKSPGVEQAPVCAPVVVPDPAPAVADGVAATAEVATTAVVMASAVVVGTTRETDAELPPTGVVIKTPPVRVGVAVAIAVVAAAAVVVVGEPAAVLATAPPVAAADAQVPTPRSPTGAIAWNMEFVSTERPGLGSRMSNGPPAAVSKPVVPQVLTPARFAPEHIRQGVVVGLIAPFTCEL